MIRAFTVLAFLLLCETLHAQSYSFSKNFKEGVVFFRDSTKKAGKLKWFPSQNEKLKFLVQENGEIQKYSPEDVFGFSVDTLMFASLHNLEVYAENYGLLGMTSKIKQTFGRIVSMGKINVYFVLITGYNALGGVIQTYPNFVFEKVEDGRNVVVAYPFGIRMRDKKYERAKEDLYIFFEDYPEVVEKIRGYKQQDDFSVIIDLVKAINRE
jgi:hypothetical protein